MDEIRRAARWSRRRIIFNNDGDDIHNAPSGDPLDDLEAAGPDQTSTHGQ